MFSLLNDNEMFLDIEGYEGRYSVSNLGRVYSHKGKGKFLKSAVNRDGYSICVLCKDGIIKTMYIHILVGNAFIGKRENGLTFDHIDINNQNNRADNIRLATRLEQNINKKCRSNTGEKNISIDKNSYKIKIRRNGKNVFRKYLAMSKYTLEDAVKIRDEFLKKESHGYKNS
tara:strand:- start:1 stop:516 length:516 start_codon:yes stop_codon:yes gene_type:complete